MDNCVQSLGRDTFPLIWGMRGGEKGVVSCTTLSRLLPSLSRLAGFFLIAKHFCGQKEGNKSLQTTKSFDRLRTRVIFIDASLTSYDGGVSRACSGILGLVCA